MLELEWNGYRSTHQPLIRLDVSIPFSLVLTASLASRPLHNQVCPFLIFTDIS